MQFFDLFKSQDQTLENLPSLSLQNYVQKSFFSKEKSSKSDIQNNQNNSLSSFKKNDAYRCQTHKFYLHDSLCLTDLKLAELYDENGDYYFIRCGTVGYVAPQILADQKYDRQLDVYSVEILLYILFTGKEPFEGNYHKKVIQNLIGVFDHQNLQMSNLALDLLKGLSNQIVKKDFLLIKSQIINGF